MLTVDISLCFRIGLMLSFKDAHILKIFQFQFVYQLSSVCSVVELAGYEHSSFTIFCWIKNLLCNVRGKSRSQNQQDLPSVVFQGKVPWNNCWHHLLESRAVVFMLATDISTCIKIYQTPNSDPNPLLKCTEYMN